MDNLLEKLNMLCLECTKWTKEDLTGTIITRKCYQNERISSICLNCCENIAQHNMRTCKPYLPRLLCRNCFDKISDICKEYRIISDAEAINIASFQICDDCCAKSVGFYGDFKNRSTGSIYSCIQNNNNDVLRLSPQ